MKAWHSGRAEGRHGSALVRGVGWVVLASCVPGVAADSGSTVMVVSLSLLGAVLVGALVLACVMFRSRTRVVQVQHDVDFMDPPGIPMVKSVTGDSLELHWAPPMSSVNKGTVAHYNIKFNIEDRTYYFDTRTALPQFNITGLQPGSRVDHIRVCAVYHGSEDEGSYSPHVYAMTNDYPGPPRGLRSQSTAQDSVTLSWGHPEFDGRTPVRRYAVSYSVDGTPRSFATFDDVPRCTIENLPFGTVLEEVMVAAVNDVGQGPPCQPLRTAETRRPGATELHITDVSNTAVKLHWVPPEEGRDDVQGYVVRYTVDGQAVEVQTDAAPEYLIAGLKPGQRLLDVQVAPISSQGEGHPSNKLTDVQTLGTCGVPTHVHVVGATDKTLTLQWTAPELHPGSDPITYYTVSYDVAGDIARVSTPNAQPSIVLSGLPAAAHVQSITVQGVVAGVPGEPSVPISGKTLVYDAPPQRLRVSLLKTHSVQLMWDPPEEPTRSYVTGYVVCYTVKQVQFRVHTKSGGTSFEVGGGGGEPGSPPLPESCHLVNVHVRAVTNRGQTSPSNVIAVRTLGKPGPVTNLRKSEEQINGMTLTWTPPEFTGGAPITKFEVHYSVNGKDMRAAAAPTATSFALRGLSRHAVVPLVSVLAVNRVGVSEAATIRGRERPAAPRRLRVVRATGTSVHLAWQAPEDDGGTPLHHFLIRFVTADGSSKAVTVPAYLDDGEEGKGTEGDGGSDGGSSARAEDGPSVRTSVVLGDGSAVGGQAFTSGAAIDRVTIVAVNLAGESEPSNQLLSASTLSQATAPKRLLVGDVGTAAVIPLRWEVPSDDGGSHVSSYVVRFTVEGKEHEVDTESQLSNFDLPGRGPGVPVTAIAVAAKTAVGVGAFSAPVSVSTLSCPKAVTVGKVSMTTVPLSWEPCDNTATPVRSYIVAYDAGGVQHTIDTGSTEPSFVIGGGGGQPASTAIPADTLVSFTVAAVNVVGVGAPSAAMEATTVAEGAPSDLSVLEFDKDSVTVAWVEPRLTAHPPLRYVVHYTVNGQDMSTEVDAPGTRAVIGDLSPGTEVLNIRVHGVSDLGPGPASTVLAKAQTLDVPGPPANAKILEVTPISITVVWKRPLNTGGRIDNYIVQYEDTTGERHELRAANPKRRRLEMDHLPHGFELNNIKVRAVNNAGVGPARDIGSACTHNVPARPEDVFIANITTTTIALEWDAPDHNGGMPITGFHVRYTVEGGDTLVTRVDSDIFAFQIAGIKPGQTVSPIQVMAENEVGIGPPSKPQRATTKLPRPPTPESPQLYRAYRSKKQLKVTWRHPQFSARRVRAGEEIVQFELQWVPSKGFSHALSTLLGTGTQEVQLDADTAARWALCHSTTVDAQAGHQWQHATIAALPNCSYDFRVRALNAMGAWSDQSEESVPIFLRAAHGERPQRRPVRGLVLGHTGGGYVAGTEEIRRFIRENLAADSEHDKAMIQWLRDQGWGALRVWARRCALMTAPQRAAEAFRLKQPPGGRVESKAPEPTPKNEYNNHVSPWLKRNRAEWVRVAETAAAGRPSLMKQIPGSHMFRTFTRGASMRRMPRDRAGRAGTSVSHGPARSTRRRAQRGQARIMEAPRAPGMAHPYA